LNERLYPATIQAVFHLGRPIIFTQTILCKEAQLFNKTIVLGHVNPAFYARKYLNFKQGDLDTQTRNLKSMKSYTLMKPFQIQDAMICVFENVLHVLSENNNAEIL
jgi:hypothetical protein